MPETLAQKIKAKYPGVYDSLPDAELEARVHKKYPGVYGHLPHSTASAEDYIPQQQGPQGSATSRFLSNAGEMLNPITIAKGIGQAVMNPIDTLSGIGQMHANQFGKAKEALGQGRVLEAAGHGAAGLLPVIGPVAAEAGEQMATGDVAGGMGKAVGLLAPVAGTRPLVSAARNTVRAVPGVAQNVAGALEAGAQSRVADVMSPKVGRQKVRLGNKADKVAPQIAKDLAREGAPFSRETFHGQVQAKHQAAKASLDSAADQRLAARSFETKPLIDGLIQKRNELVAHADVGSQFPREVIRDIDPVSGQVVKSRGPREPIGENVVPAPNAARVAMIDEAIRELRTLGRTTTYEPIRRIRQAFDGPAEVVYNPATTADFLTARGKSLGAADVTGVLRDNLAKWDPATATANAQYSLYRNADDVLKAVQEVERTRPRVGRQIASRISGGVIGGQAGGAAGAVAGYIFAPIIESVLASGATTQLKTAALMQRMADAVRTGNVKQVNELASALEQVKRNAAVTGSVQAATNPNESRNRTTGSAWPAQAPAR